MTIGLFLDLHGTLLQSNQAWITAFSEIDPAHSAYYEHEIQRKRSRHELCCIAGCDFSEVDKRYFEHLKPREDIVTLVEILQEHYPTILLSNGPRDRVMRDMTLLKTLKFQAVYSGCDGRKENSMYLESILDFHQWPRAFLLGNDMDEDFVESPRITSILVPDKPKNVILELFLRNEENISGYGHHG